MRLLFVSHSVPPADQPLSNLGGMQRVAADLFSALGQHPDVELHSLLLRTSWRWTHVLTGPFIARLLREVPRAVQRYSIDVVLHSSMVTASVSVPLREKLRALGVRSAAIVHGRDVTLPSSMYQRLVPRVFEALDLVLPVSRATGDACLQRGLSPEKLRVVPNGINIQRFDVSEDQTSARERMAAAFGLNGMPGGLPDDALLLCSVGRQVERKGFAWFITHVLPSLPERVHYWLAGEGPETEKIREVVSARGLEGRVRMLGRVSEEQLHLLYQGADLFIMPNIPVSGDMEGFGVVMLEAGLCRLPTVAADLEGIRDVISPGKNGHLIESGDAETFENVIRSYDSDRERLRSDGEHARAYVLDHFTWERVADRYMEVLRGIE